jgi:hypothetical protein
MTMSYRRYKARVVTRCACYIRSVQHLMPRQCINCPIWTAVNASFWQDWYFNDVLYKISRELYSTTKSITRPARTHGLVRSLSWDCNITDQNVSRIYVRIGIVRLQTYYVHSRLFEMYISVIWSSHVTCIHQSDVCSWCLAYAINLLSPWVLTCRYIYILCL